MTRRGGNLYAFRFCSTLVPQSGKNQRRKVLEAMYGVEGVALSRQHKRGQKSMGRAQEWLQKNSKRIQSIADPKSPSPHYLERCVQETPRGTRHQTAAHRAARQEQEAKDTERPAGPTARTTSAYSLGVGRNTDDALCPQSDWRT